MKKERIINYLYKVVMLFIIGCFIGCIFETILCFLQRGHFESRRGLIYGPLNPVYGIGFLFICLLLKKEKRNYMIFLKGFFYGGVIEYLCSWFQEMFFHTTSWNYNKYALNFDGRTSIYHMICWGIGTFLIMEYLYPNIIKLIDKIKLRYRLVITIVILIFLIVDITISSLAFIRYKERLNKIPAHNSMDRFMDEHYPNEYLVKIYPNIRDSKTGVKLSKMK
ncbi:MAG: putative ABC transporter permease [Bacilli bacterium]|nr:putative ABC transporter permease [Bacilli bacterium]